MSGPSPSLLLPSAVYPPPSPRPPARTVPDKVVGEFRLHRDVGETQRIPGRRALRHPRNFEVERVRTRPGVGLQGLAGVLTEIPQQCVLLALAAPARTEGRTALAGEEVDVEIYKNKMGSFRCLCSALS